MADRLGNVLYWLACGIAGLITAGGFYLWIVAPPTRPPDPANIVFALIVWGIALLIWLAGRALRYVLSGT